MQPENPHFAFPFQRGQVVEQDTLDHVMGCVELICRCPVGFRIERPDFGIVWHEYRLEVIPQGVMQSALREFEGRAKITTDVARDYKNLGDALITVEVEGG